MQFKVGMRIAPLVCLSFTSKIEKTLYKDLLTHASVLEFWTLSCVFFCEFEGMLAPRKASALNFEFRVPKFPQIKGPGAQHLRK